MEHLPLMNIHFPPTKENELHEEMKRRATPPWSPQAYDAFGKASEDGYFFFHCDAVSSEPSCTLSIHREEPGHWIVYAIIPDKGQVKRIPVKQYKTILSNFESEIAEPAATAIKGMTAIEISQYRLEDYFSPEAVNLLRRFCMTSNQSDLGQHLSDQEKWIAFLICVYDERNEVHCLNFRKYT